jgi:Ca2+-binding RTX toxin-like protein
MDGQQKRFTAMAISNARMSGSSAAALKGKRKPGEMPGLGQDDSQAIDGGFSTQAVTASFSSAGGVLTGFGDSLDNTITLSRDAAGKILVNGGAVPVLGGTPTVANTSLLRVFGQGGNDVITINETNGAMPRANLFGGAGNDTLTGGSGNDMLFG